jgi:diguanylate cyclase (GGDEF)-like protein
MPYFWETPWFIGAMAALFLLVLWSLYRLRIHRMMLREKELEELVALRTRELEDASLRDSLTGLRNRRYVTDILMPDTELFAERKHYRRKSDEPQQAHPLDGCLGVFLIDIDHFKVVNDTLGHDAGDRVLKQFSELLSMAMRKDDVAVRWGGEEFLVILKHTSYDFVEEFARRIRGAVESTDFVVAAALEPTLHRTCSIGYVSFPFYKGDPELIGFEQAIRLADLGLYYSKQNGRNLAVAVRPTEKLPEPQELPRMLASLEYGTTHGLLRIEAAGKGSEELAVAATPVES